MNKEIKRIFFLIYIFNNIKHIKYMKIKNRVLA